MFKNFKSYRAILFDLDDTLIDFKKSEKIGLSGCYQKHFQSVATYEHFVDAYARINQDLWQQAERGETLVSSIGRERFQRLSALYNIPFNLAIVQDYEEDLIANCTWVDGAVGLLDRLQMQNVKIGFVTNGVSYVQRGKCRQLGLTRYSDIVVISEEVGFTKPHPEIFQRALQLLGEPKEDILVVGDSLTSDGQGAKQLGLDFCWYNPRYVQSSMSWEPDFTIDHLSKLETFF